MFGTVAVLISPFFQGETLKADKADKSQHPTQLNRST
jgi:hypothetical protein